MSRHETFLRVKATEEGDDRIIEGWATTGREDRVGDIVAPQGARYELPLPLLFAHKHDEPIGAVVTASVTSAGIRIRARLTRGVERAEEVWKLIADGALTACSIGFQAIRSTPLTTGGLRFDEWSWHELSIVAVPCNPDARITVGKGIVYTKPEPSETDADHKAKQFIGVLDKIAGKASDAAKVYSYTGKTHRFMRHGIRELYTQQVELAGAIEVLAKGFGERLRALEAKAGIGATAADMARRLEQAEERLKELSEGGFCYRGYWREGCRARRGDAFTHNGSVWWAIRSTGDTPCNESADWHVAVRKGRDARGEW